MNQAPGTSFSPSRKNVFYFLFVFFVLSWFRAGATELDLYPVEAFSRDAFSLSFFREERLSYYWVNVGVPDLFFNGINQISTYPNPVAYQVQGIEYGVRAAGWLDDKLQLRLTLPLEANALVDSEAVGVTFNVTQIGDLEIGGTYLLEGKREKGNFIGLDGLFRFPTGTNPFNEAFPILATGKGASEEDAGLTLGQELGGFSFFQSIHYEKTQPINVDPANSLFGGGTFQWPDNFRAMGRIEYLVFHRAQRVVSLFYELNLRVSGLMEMNHQPITYGQGQLTDRLFFSTLGLVVRVDQQFSVEGKGTYFPFETFLFDKSRPDYGLIFSLSMQFRPF